MRYLSLDGEIFINQFIQNIHSSENVKKWFAVKIYFGINGKLY